jgi:hypothetical protein
MDARTAYTDAEWKRVKDLPSYVALAVVASGGSGPVEMVMESTAAAKAIAEAREDADPLVQAVVADLSHRDDTDKVAKPDARSREQFHAAALGAVRDGMTLIRAKTPDSAQAYGAWLLGLAHKVAESAKEGSHLGIGGVRVSPEEEATLAELTAALEA